jgi:hypothetical protein
MIMKLRQCFALTMLAAFPVQAVAAKADACMTREEARGFAIFLMPDAVVALRDKCKVALPSSAYLNMPSASERFRPESDRRWPMAKRAFAKMSGGEPLDALIGEDATRKVVTGAIVAGITKDMKPRSCAGANQMLEALAPLPIENVDMLLDSFFLLGLGNDKKGGLRVCADSGEMTAKGSN